MGARSEDQPQHVRVQRDGAVATITIDRPSRFNSLDVRTAQDLRRAGLACARDGEIRCIVLTGVGKAFCSGADLKYIREFGEDADLTYLKAEAGKADRHGYGACFKQIVEYIHSTISELRHAPKPVVAAVQGIAAAGGLGLAMSCDLVLASDGATFEWAYGRTGLTGAESSTFFLPHLVGLQRAMQIMLLNPRLSAAAARDAGIVTDVFSDETFDGEVAAVATRLAEGPTRAFAVAKRLINESAGVDRLDQHLEKELDHLVRAADGPEFAEGIDAFFTKRPPRF